MNIVVNTVRGEQRIRAVGEAITGPVLLKLIGLRLASFVDESFRTRGRGRWRPLAPGTLELRRHGGDVPLQDTGRYKMSFVTETDNATYVEVGSNLKVPGGAPLAAIHEFGTAPYVIRVKRAKILAAKFPRRAGFAFFGKEVNHPGIPARLVLPTVAETIQLVTTTVEAVVAQAERRFGPG